MGGKLCYGRLCQYAGKDGKCYPSQTKLAGDLGISTRQVRNYIQELKEYNLIFVSRANKNHSNFYRFLKHKWMGKSAPSLTNQKAGGSKGVEVPPERSFLSERKNTSSKENHIRDKHNKGEEVDTREGRIYRGFCNRYPLTKFPPLFFLREEYKKFKEGVPGSKISLPAYVKGYMLNMVETRRPS